MKIRCYLRCPFFIGCVLLFAVPLVAQRTPLITRLEQAFPKRIDRTHLIFEFNREYVVQVFIDKDSDKIKLFTVFNREFLSGSKREAIKPEKTTLSARDYRLIVEKLDSISRVGELKVEGQVSAYTNLKQHVFDVYENGIMERIKRSISSAEMIGVSFWYYRPVAGIVEDTIRLGAESTKSIDKVKIAGCWYWSSAKNLQKDNAGTFELAGPIDCGGEPIDGGK